MKTALVSLAAALLVLSSCSNRNNNPLAASSSGKSKGESRFSYKSRPSDLVDDIYYSKLDSNQNLKRLQERLDGLEKERSDSATAFANYTALSESFYRSANGHLKSIHDSTLAHELRAQIDSSRRRYEERIAVHEAWMASSKKKMEQLSDQNERLKLLITLGEIDRYQRQQLPPALPLQGFSMQLDQLSRQLDSAIVNSKSKTAQ